MAGKKASKKALPTWVSVLVLAVLFVGVAMIYALQPSRDIDIDTADPGAKKLREELFEQFKNVEVFKAKANPEWIPWLVKDGVIPPEWAEGNYVPWYDSKRRR